MLGSEASGTNMFAYINCLIADKRPHRAMPEAKLTLTIPERAWPGEITRAYPETRIRILAGMAESETGVGLVELRSSDLGDVLDDIREHPTVESMEVLQRTDGEALAQIRTELPLLLFAARGSGLPLELPFEIQEGQATWNLTTSQEAISALGDQFDAMGIGYTVEYLQQDVTGTEELLTDDQRALVREAIARGYYDTPRTCSLTELADAVGRAKSTTSETLHRAEERVMKEYAAQALDGSVASSVDSP